MVFRMLAVLAEFERDQIAERTKGALSHMRNQGKRISGKIPYGFNLATDGESLVPDPVEQHGLQVIEDLRTNALGRRRIAAELTRLKIPSKTGASWSPQAVGSILRRAKACRTVAGESNMTG